MDDAPIPSPMNLPDGFDCVNKPKYECKEKVDRAQAKCSLCIVRKPNAL